MILSGFLLFSVLVGISTAVPMKSCKVSENLICLGQKKVAPTKASSSYPGLDTSSSCLNNVPSGAKGGSWSSLTLDNKQWIQVDLGIRQVITKIVTQGRQDYDQWVTSYTVTYSLTDTAWKTVKSPEGTTIVFQGNNDRSTPKTNLMPKAVYARFVKLHPVTWSGHISLRWEVHGCDMIALACKEGKEDPLVCSVLGPMARLSASSSWDASHSPSRSCLDTTPENGHTGAWSARVNDKNQWIQMDLPKYGGFVAIATQGRADYDQWVKSYTLSYNPTGREWLPIQDDEFTTIVYTGNVDRNTKVKHNLPYSTVGKSMRLHPVTWHGHISLRWEVYGCTHCKLPYDFVYPATKQDVLDGREKEPTEADFQALDIEQQQTKKDIERLEEEARRKKRGIGGILNVVRALTMLGSTAWILYNDVIKKGCGSHPSICSDRDKIDEINKDIKVMRRHFDAAYNESFELYKYLRERSYDNGFIAFFINNTNVMIKTGQDLGNKYAEDLDLAIPKTADMYNKTINSTKDFWKSSVGVLSYQLENIDKMIKETADFGMYALIGTLVGQFLIANFFHLYQKSVTQFENDAKARYINAQLEDLDLKDQNLRTSSRRLTVSYMKSSKTLAITGPNDLRDIYAAERARLTKSLTELNDAELPPGHKTPSGQLMRKSLFNTVTRPIKFAGAVITSPVWAPIYIKRNGFKAFRILVKKHTSSFLSSVRRTFTGQTESDFRATPSRLNQWAGNVMNVLSIVGDGITIAMNVVNWGKVAAHVSDALGNFTQYKKDLYNEQVKLNASTAELRTLLNKTTYAFINQSSFFKDILINTTKYANLSFAKNIGFQFNLTIGLFKPNFFETVNTSNVHLKQHEVKLFLKSIDYKFKSAVTQLRGRVMFYQEVHRQYLRNKTVTFILESAKTALGAESVAWPAEIKNFGKALIKQDIVCYIATMFHLYNKTYDFYVLSRMKPGFCDITDVTWNDMEEEARLNRYRADAISVVKGYVTAGKSTVEQILDAVKLDFARRGTNDARMRAYANGLTVKDVLCFIAVVTKAAQYQYYELALYRKGCSNVTDAEFQQSLQQRRDRYFRALMKEWIKEGLGKEDVTTTLQVVKGAFTRRNETGMVEFQNTLTVKDILCEIAHLTSAAVYNYFKMDLYRNNACSAITNAQFQASLNEANKARWNYMMGPWIKTDMDAKKSVADILANVVSAFKKQTGASAEMVAFANSLTAKDIVCKVSALTSAATYDFYNMSLFRAVSPCSSMADATFNAEKARADKLRGLISKISSEMDLCDAGRFCDCPTGIMAVYSISMDVLKELIKLVRPSKTQYCGQDRLNCSPKCISIP